MKKTTEAKMKEYLTMSDIQKKQGALKRSRISEFLTNWLTDR